MIDTSASGMAYNRLTNLDGVEDRIIYYLLNKANKTDEEKKIVDTIWRILLYDDVDALKESVHPSDEYDFDDVEELICDSNLEDQSEKRIFRTPRMEDSWTVEGSMLKVYVDSIIPVDHLRSIVNIGIDVVVNTKIINVKAPDGVIKYIDEANGKIQKVNMQSRVTTLTQAVISLLNGAAVQGVGKMIFSRQQSIYNQAQYGLWNNRNFEGMKIVIGVSMSGVD